MLPETCCGCGACCFSPDDCYVLVTHDDYTRLGALAPNLTHFRSGLCFMRTQDGHCAALELRPDGQLVCGIYEQRPEICRELERGSSGCLKYYEQNRANADQARTRARSVDVAVTDLRGRPTRS